MRVTNLVSIIAASITFGVAAQGNNAEYFDTKSQVLTLSNVLVDGTQYSGIQIKLKDVQIVNPGLQSKAVDSNCPTEFTATQVASIKPGLSVDAVNQILGCQYQPQSTVMRAQVEGTGWAALPWQSGLRQVLVSFDLASGKVVANPPGSWNAGNAVLVTPPF